MADLGANSLWSNMEQGADNVTTDILGPAYSYADNVPAPGSLGVGNEGSFGQLNSNLGAVGTYVSTMISGDPPLGNRFYVNTGGTCTAPDGSIQSRYNIINNMPSGSEIMPAGFKSFGGDLNGLIPGIVGDIEGLNPLYMLKSLAADSSPKCGCYKCDVTSGPQYRFLTPELSPDFDTTICTQVDASNCMQTVESFSNPETDSTIPTLIAAAGILFLLFLK